MKIPTLLWLSLICILSFSVARSNAAAAKADVGVLLDLETAGGKMFKTSVSMAIEDFYSQRSNYSTVIVPYFRDSGGDVVTAASAAIELMKNTQVLAILGPLKSIQAGFVVEIGDAVRVPIISPATSPTLSPKESPYFIRSAWCSSSQAKAIAAIVKAYGWKEVSLVYEDSIYGSGLVPFLTEKLLETNALVSYQTIVSPSAHNDRILKVLYDLQTRRTRVFVVHMGPALVSGFFRAAKEAGMMSRGYVWIVADLFTSFLDSDSVDSMQGVLGVRAYAAWSNEIRNFGKRWRRRFRTEYPDSDRAELDVFGLWAYDSATALAVAIQHVVVPFPRFEKPTIVGNLTDLEAIGTSIIGPSLVKLIRNFRFKGLSGDFYINNGQLEPSAFEIVNVIGKGDNIVGFWTDKHGISKELNMARNGNLGAVVWPGHTTAVPKGWEFPTGGNKLRVGVLARKGFPEITNIEKNETTNEVVATGFCIDVFREAMALMPYAVPYEFSTFERPFGKSTTDYKALADHIFVEEKFDVAVGSVTVTAERLEYTDFTFPYTESGVAAIVPIKHNAKKNAWIFMKPLTTGLWLTIGGFFVFTGFAVWILEHRVNKAFRGSAAKQVGMIFWFSFSTLVFAHREKVISNLTRFVMIVWVFVVLVLTSSYTANLTTMLTVQQLQPTITDFNDLIKNGEYVGFQDGSFIGAFLNNLKFDRTKFRNYSSFEEYDEALSKGSRNGGVGAIVEELPYIRLFLTKYCHKYTMIGPTYMTSGFGFAFPKGSPLVPDLSRAILKLKEGEEMTRISKKWFNEEGCNASDGTADGSQSLNLDSFKGLFLIAGVSSSSALAVFFVEFLFENRYILASPASIKQKLYGLARVFAQEKDDILSRPKESGRDDRGCGASAESTPAISISSHQEGMFSPDEGFSAEEGGEGGRNCVHDGAREG